MAPLLDLHDVTVAYHRRPVLWDIDFVLSEPHLVGIVGPERCGEKHAASTQFSAWCRSPAARLKCSANPSPACESESVMCRSATASIGIFPSACSTW